MERNIHRSLQQLHRLNSKGNLKEEDKEAQEC